jgi:hypothetical protein
MASASATAAPPTVTVTSTASTAAETLQVPSMPPPPVQYFSLYTDEAVARGVTPQPPTPIGDVYHMFGQPFQVNDEAIVQSLESQGIKRLYPASKVFPCLKMQRLYGGKQEIDHFL